MFSQKGSIFKESDMLFSLLIPSLTDRAHLLSSLQYEIMRQQSGFSGLEVLANVDDGGKAVGQKRNELLLLARGLYVAFIDDDDWISPDYTGAIMQALESRPDCIGFEGYITTNGQNGKVFRMSKEFEYGELNNCYYRPINHLCPVKREIALHIRYPEINCGEDYDYCIRLKSSGLLRREVYIGKVLYHYRFDTLLTSTQKH